MEPRRISTEQVYSDLWTAIDLNCYEGGVEDGDNIIGIGKPESEAIHNLINQYEENKTRSQRMREAGYTRRPSWRSLPKDY